MSADRGLSVFGIAAANLMMMAGVLGCVLLSSGCSSTEAEELTASIEIDNPQVTLRASRAYGPHTTWEDGEATLAQPIEFTIPRQIPVVQGNAGNHKARLSFRLESGEQVDCDYRGGSRDPHPDTEVEYMRAQAYLFERCSSGAIGGSVQQASWFKLHAQLGDQKDPAGLTQIQVQLGQQFGTLEPPISPAESIAIREGFSWQSTAPLPETNSQGLPALYYTIVYVEERDQVEALDELRIHHDSLPLFSEELTRWSGQRGIFDFEGDGTGLFVFALMPGATYNLLRQAALEGDVIYRVIALREVPASARASDGSVSYDALRDSAFRYLDQDPPLSPVSGEGLGQQRQELLSRLRQRVAAIAAVVKTVVVAVQQGIGFVDRTINGDVRLTLRLDVRNTDPAFGLQQPMLRTWGERAGQQVRLPGVKVTARQHWGVAPTKFLEDTNAEGVASMRVGRERNTSLCLATENAAAEITSFLIEKQVCDFGSIDGARLSQDLSVDVTVRNRHFNLLAQATEGYAYLREVVQLTPRKAIILVGRLANWVSPAGAAAAPCFGFPNRAYDSAVELAARLIEAFGGGLGYGVAKLAGVIYAVDIVVADDPRPRVNPGGVVIDANTDSRGLLSHEYGHFALASLLYAVNPENITVAYTDAIISRITNLQNGLPPPTHEAAYLNEAFADFFAEQIAGGKNYVQYGIEPFDLGMQYCNAAEACGCVDRNGTELIPPGTPGPFRVPVTRVYSLLHDAFDGWPRLQRVPSGGAVWSTATMPFSFNVNAAWTGDASDERVRLQGWQLRRILERWDARANVLRQDNFLGGLADVMSESGYGWCDMCRLFALHDSRMAGGSAAQMQALCNSAPISTWIGPMPPGTSCQLDCDDGNPCTVDTIVTGGGCTLSCRHTPAPSTVVCRAANGACDAEERCDGVSTTCPADSVQPQGLLCRGASGACDAAEFCDGASPACPADLAASRGTLCRNSAGPCDVAESCDGTSRACPPDGFAAVGTVCRGATGPCDASETCSGAAASCPADGFLPAGTTCRASSAACDPAETCSGSAMSCPADVNTCQSSATFPSGVADGFSTANGPESPQPSDGLRTFVRDNYAFAEIRDYDDARSNRFFAHTFTGLTRSGVTICGARLTLRVSSGDSNDAVLLGFVEASGTLGATRWSRSLLDLGIAVGGDRTLTLDVAALPTASGPAVNLLPLMQSKGWLDIYVQDDSAVDYLLLEVDYCQ